MQNTNTSPAEGPKRIGIYSGSFNPVHEGHLNIARFIIENKLVDGVWFLVSPRNPLKDTAELIDEHTRLEMLKLAIDGNPAMTASDFEFSMPVPSYSSDTLRQLSLQYPENQFSLIIGSDNALVFDQWKDYQYILDNYPVLVYPRMGYDFSRVASSFPAMHLLASPLFEVSSTQIRKLIETQKDAGQWLHPYVYQFIIRHNLYR